MGIGGYQLVLKVNSSITPGSYETTVESKFVYSGYPYATEAEKYANFVSQPIGGPNVDQQNKNACKPIIAQIQAADLEE